MVTDRARQDAVLCFGVMLACAAAVAAAVGFQVVVGFVMGVFFTLVAAAIAGSADFD
jgi:hypothetical protein